MFYILFILPQIALGCLVYVTLMYKLYVLHFLSIFFPELYQINWYLLFSTKFNIEFPLIYTGWSSGDIFDGILAWGNQDKY